jgi:hypothetical protein
MDYSSNEEYPHEHKFIEREYERLDSPTQFFLPTA